jgi:iron complex transport system substrate-binding protein
VVAFNQRSVDEILQVVRMVGGLIGESARAEAFASELSAGLQRIRDTTAHWTRRPRVFFEEWPEPLISGIRWVEELIEIAGGKPVFPELRFAALAKDRICDPAEVVRRDPEVIVASWCGKPVRTSRIVARPGWEAITAVRTARVYEVKSTYILQPGPAALTDGVQQIHRILAESTGRAELRPH